MTESFPIPVMPLSAGRRVYAVGDIHGRLDLLETCLEAIRDDLDAFPCARPQRVFLGDYIDRGPDSCGVLHTLSSLDDGVPTTFLSGNHELYLKRFLEDFTHLKLWSRVGADTTLASYGVRFPFRLGLKEMAETQALLLDHMPASHQRFLAQLDMKLEVEGLCFVHAGIRPGVPLAQQTPEDLMTIREPFLSAVEKLPAFVVHGHTPVDQPQIGPSRLNIDTGAYKSGILTCAVLAENNVRFLYAS